MQSTALVPFLLVVLGTGLARAQAVSSAQPRPTYVRVVDAKGKPLEGARVYFLSTVRQGFAWYFPSELRRVVAGKRGLVKVLLPRERRWVAWAVADRGKQRLACEVKGEVEPGRAFRLKLKSFGVPFVRFMQLAPWRKKIGEGHALRLRFTSDGTHSYSFDQELPDEEDPIVRVPDLPYGNYFPSLIDEQGSLLDSVYFSPEFHEGDAQVEPLYDRKYPYKRVMLGKPYVFRGRVVDGDGKALEGARIYLENSLLVRTRGFTATDAQGRFRILTAVRAAQERAFYSVSCRVLAAHRHPHSFTLQVLKRPEDREELIKLPRYPYKTWWLEDNPKTRKKGDRYFLTALWRNKRENWGNTLFYEVRCSAEGELQLPSPSKGSNQYDLWRLREGRLEPLLFSAFNRAMQGGRIDLAAGSSVRFSLNKEKRGFARVCHLSIFPKIGGALFATRRLQRTFSAMEKVAMTLPAGDYAAYAECKGAGDAFAEFRVGAGAATEQILALRSFHRVVGVLLDPDEKAVAGATVSLYPIQFQAANPLLQQLLVQRSKSAQTDADGGFEFRVSGLLKQVQLSASQRVQGAWAYANLPVVVADTERLRLVLRRQ